MPSIPPHIPGNRARAVSGCCRKGTLIALLIALRIVVPGAGGGEAAAAAAGCPPEAEALGLIASLPLERITRVTGFEAPAPADLTRAAVRRPGEVAVARDGKRGFAQVLVELPRERLWKAVNDEDRYAEHLGLIHSQVVGGTPRGTERLLFQAFRRMGVGRWWVDRVTLNGDLDRTTGGRLWELVWEDDFDDFEPSPPALAAITADLRRVEWTRGAWVFAALGPECTFVDYFLWSEPGGLISTFQALGAKGAIRDTVEGLIRYAEEGGRPGTEGAGPGASVEPPFVRPDGTPLP